MLEVIVFIFAACVLIAAGQSLMAAHGAPRGRSEPRQVARPDGYAPVAPDARPDAVGP